MKAASNLAASISGSTGRGLGASVTGISSTSAPTRPGRVAGENSCRTVSLMFMPEPSRAPGTATSVLVRIPSTHP